MSILAGLLICLSPIPSDGDSARCGTSRVTLRLFGVRSVDGTPEDVAAEAALTGLAAGGWRCDPAPIGPTASYSRWVVICHNSAGVDVGRELIRTGYAVEECAYSQNRTYPLGYYGTCPPK